VSSDHVDINNPGPVKLFGSLEKSRVLRDGSARWLGPVELSGASESD
jgi:hypothetical protein